VNRWRTIPARICGAVAALFLATMMLLTVADVTLRAAFNAPIRGVYELVELLLAGTFFIALPAVFLRDDNILVNVVDERAPRLVPWLRRLAAVLAVAIFVIMAWQGLIAARDSYEFHDVTAELSLSRIWHWSVVLFGIIGAGIAALAMGVSGDDRR
jgi:TRAP-type C4-dicarboxylate transport system permease small subunit